MPHVCCTFNLYAKNLHYKHKVEINRTYHLGYVDGQNLTNYKVKTEPKIKPYGSQKCTKGP